MRRWKAPRLVRHVANWVTLLVITLNSTGQAAVCGTVYVRRWRQQTEIDDMQLCGACEGLWQQYSWSCSCAVLKKQRGCYSPPMQVTAAGRWW